MGLSLENPHYWQLLMHSFERYSGAKSRMTLPKRCCVNWCERKDSMSRNSEAAGEIKCAKSARDSLCLDKLSRTAAVPTVSDFRTNEDTGNELNSATKLTRIKVANSPQKSRKRIHRSQEFRSIFERTLSRNMTNDSRAKCILMEKKMQRDGQNMVSLNFFIESRSNL